jgi:hypothetical protein
MPSSPLSIRTSIVWCSGACIRYCLELGYVPVEKRARNRLILAAVVLVAAAAIAAATSGVISAIALVIALIALVFALALLGAAVFRLVQAGAGRKTSDTEER